MPKLNRAVNRIEQGTSYKIEVDLDEVFQTIIPNSSRFRQAVGQEILDIIRTRTQDEKKPWSGGSWAGYSEEYADSLEGAVAGKKEGEKANLTNSGDMLGLMDVVDETLSTITIGWTDSEEASKAHGHISGNVGKKRDFLGLNEKELQALRTELEPLRQSLVEDNPQGDVDSSVQTLGALIEGEQSVPSTTTTLGGLLNQLFGGAQNDG